MAELQRREITERIRQARTEAGLTQPEMANLLEVAMRTYQNYESERVPWDLMGRISDITGRSLRWLLHGESEATTYADLAGMVEQQKALATAIAELTEVVRRLSPPGEGNERRAS